jgi:hypothetical protein
MTLQEPIPGLTPELGRELIGSRADRMLVVAGKTSVVTLAASSTNATNNIQHFSSSNGAVGVLMGRSEQRS